MTAQHTLTPSPTAPAETAPSRQLQVHIPARGLLISLLTLIATVILVISAIVFAPQFSGTLEEGVLLYGAGAVLLSVAILLQRHYAKAVTLGTSQPVADARPLNRWMILIGGAMILLMMQVNLLSDINAAEWGALYGMSPHLQAGLLLGGVSLIVWGVNGGERLRFPRLRLQAHHILLAGILIVAAVLRLWNLEEGIHRWLDEIHYADAVARLWYENSPQILHPFSDLTAFTWLFPYFQQWTAWLTGPGLTGLRLVSAAFGIMQVYAVYLLGKTLFDRPAALVAALLLATFPPHIHFSRIGINNIADPVMATLAIYFLVRGIKHGRRLDYALAGVCLGFTHYFYEGGRLFFTIFIILWIAWLVLFARRDGPDAFRMPRRENLWTFILMALVLIAPLIYVWAFNAYDLTPRYENMGRDPTSWQVLSEQLGYTEPIVAFLREVTLPLQGLIRQPETGWFYGGQTPFILWPIVPLFLSGVVWCIWRIRRMGGSLLFWWLMAAAVGNSLLVDPISSPRYLVVFPAIALIMAVGLRYTLPLLLDVLRPSSRVLYGLMALIVTAAGIYQIHYYFDIHLPGYYADQVQNRRDDSGVRFKDFDDALFRAVLLPPNTDVHIISRSAVFNFNVQTVRKFYNRVKDLRIAHMFPEEFTSDYLDLLPRYLNHAFFIDESNTAAYLLIQQYFDVDPPQFGPYPVPPVNQYVMIFAPAERNWRAPVFGDESP